MIPHVPVKRRVVALAAAVTLGGGVLGVTLGGSADAASNRVHVNTAARQADPATSAMLARLAQAQGVRKHPTPKPSPTPTTTQAPTPGPTAGSTPTAGSSPTAAPTSHPTDGAGTDHVAQGSTLTLSEDFDGASGSAPRRSMWQAATGGRWGNNELECYTDDRANSALDGHGDLVITARYTPGHVCSDGATNKYTSARLTTEHLAVAKYGQVRVRAKIPSAGGVWPAIWLLGDDNDQIGWPNAGEMDMMEAIGQDRTTVYGTIHAPSSSGGLWQMGDGYTVSSPIDTNFHVYGLDWTPSSITLSVDGHDYKTMTRSQVQAAGGRWVFDRPFFLLLNVAVGGDWPGTPKDNAVFPASMTVDYVRVYS